jgi:hypothetical protein
MHVHIAGFLLALLLVAAVIFGLWEVVGWWLVYGPLVLGSLVALVFVAPRLVRKEREWRQRRLDAPRLAALNLRRQIAASEATLGIPVATDGRCPVCQAPRVAGASFCTHCRSALTSFPTAHPLPLIVCPRCAERQPEGGRFCWACGARLAVPTPEPVVTYVDRTPVASDAPQRSQGL